MGAQLTRPSVVGSTVEDVVQVIFQLQTSVEPFPDFDQRKQAFPFYGTIGGLGDDLLEWVNEVLDFRILGSLIEDSIRAQLPSNERTAGQRLDDVFVAVALEDDATVRSVLRSLVFPDNSSSRTLQGQLINGSQRVQIVRPILSALVDLERSVPAELEAEAELQ